MNGVGFYAKPNGNTKHTLHGQKITIAQAAELAGVNDKTIAKRLKRGLTMEEAIASALHQARVYTCHGMTMTLNDWSRVTGIPRDTIATRLRRGWTLERALDPNGRYKRVEGFGESHTIPEWAKILGYTRGTLYTRLSRGMTIEQIAEGTAYGAIQKSKADPGANPGGGAV